MPSRQIPALIAALKDNDPQVRTVAAKTLGALGPDAQEAVPALAELLSTEDVIPAARALASIGFSAREAVPALIKLLNNKEGDVRWNAARALGDIGPEAKAAVPKLIERLADPDAGVREHAAEALGLWVRNRYQPFRASSRRLETKSTRFAATPFGRWPDRPSRQGRPSRHQGIIQG